MGLFDKIFGRGASDAAKQPDAQQVFNQLRQKYQEVLNTADQQHVQLTSLYAQQDKLLLKGVAPSEQAKNIVWDRIKAVDANHGDLVADITVQQQAAPAPSQAAPSQPAAQSLNKSYTVQSGDTLSKISRQFYGDSDEYMRIFYANRDKLNDPDKIQVGQQLIIPPDDDA